MGAGKGVRGAMAKSSPARSAPVCPPLMIFPIRLTEMINALGPISANLGWRAGAVGEVQSALETESLIGSPVFGDSGGWGKGRGDSPEIDPEKSGGNRDFPNEPDSIEPPETRETNLDVL